MRRCVYIFIFTLLLGSCSNVQLKRQMQYVLGAEINLPHNLEYVCGKDSISVDLNELKLIKLIQYYDPKECALCKSNVLE